MRNQSPQELRNKLNECASRSDKARKKYGCACTTCVRHGAKADKLGHKFISPHACVNFIRDKYVVDGSLLVVQVPLHRVCDISTGRYYYHRRDVDCYVLQKRINASGGFHELVVAHNAHNQLDAHDVIDGVVYQSMGSYLLNE